MHYSYHPLASVNKIQEPGGSLDDQNKMYYATSEQETIIIALTIVVDV